MLRYAEPLLAERAFIAEQAQGVEIRRSGGGATLLESATLATGAPPDDLTWDAWRRDDGKWIVSASFASRGRQRAAHWTYDHAGRNIHPLDDDARLLMGVAAVADDAIVEALDLASQQPRPRLVAVPDDAGTAGDAADPSTGAAASDSASGSADDGAAPTDDAAASASTSAREETVTLTRPTPAKRARGKRARASVPSWDEILFGATRPEEPS